MDPYSQLLSSHFCSAFASHPLQKQLRKEPPLYIIGTEDYKGVLKFYGNELKQNQKACLCHESTFWSEIVSHPEIKKVLNKWQQERPRKLPFSATNLNGNPSERVENMQPFRMILHKLQRVKIFGSVSDCKYFALLWIPCNEIDGFTEDLYNQLISAFNHSNYFCSKLGKQCLYISGPQFSDEEFNLDVLAENCHSKIIAAGQGEKHHLQTEIQLELDIVIHELAHNDCCDYGFFPPHYSDDDDSSASDDYVYLTKNSSIQMNDREQYILTPRSKHSCFSVPLYLEKKAAQNERDISFTQQVKYHSFAFVWITSYHSSSDENNAYYARGRDECAIGGNAKSSLLNFDYKEEKYIDDNLEDVKLKMLPTLNIMRLLHQKPLGGNSLWNVEMMGYYGYGSYGNLDLLVERKFVKFDFLMFVLQVAILPIAVILPPSFFLRGVVKPRFRPIPNGIPHDELDKTEQIPYDIARLWRPYRWINKNGRDVLLRVIVFRVISFVIACLVFCIILIGPFLYKGAKHHTIDHLVFFDCYGSLIFYLFMMLTASWWSCASKVMIGPQEHKLLFFKLLVYRPLSQNIEHITRRTDWALANLAPETSLTTLSYAFGRGCLEIRRPTSDLLSFRRFRCKKPGEYGSSKLTMIRRYICYIIAMVVFFGVLNLENLEEKYRPFYVEEDLDGTVPWLMIYSILSTIFQCFILMGLMLMWETMIDRIRRQYRNVRLLSNLIVRSTYNEYMEFDNIDNILSWITLEHHIKRIGMTLFSAVETPLLSLLMISLVSFSSCIYCYYNGVGLKLFLIGSTFSNSALSTWFFLCFISLLQVLRMLWYGKKYSKESKKQEMAIKRQCGTMNALSLQYFLEGDKLSIEQRMAIQSSQVLLSHVVHSEIVPRVFGIAFDDLTAKAVYAAVVSITPTIVIFLVKNWQYVDD